MFPICRENGDPVAFGGRILPGSADPAKYKNSAETPIYAKSKTLYGLNWAKGDIVAADQVIVCEGYTDVIGFHRAGVKRAVATCGTALTEEHVRMLKRFASRVVLAFDADAAGQGAAEQFYEWEQEHQVRVSVASFPQGQDPGELSLSDPEALAAAVDTALPFLGFRLQRRHAAASARATPEERVRLAEQAMARGQRAPRRQRAQAVRRSGGQPHGPADQRPGGYRRAAQRPPNRAGHADPSRGQRRERRVRRHCAACCSAGTTWPDGSTRCCSSTMSLAARSWPSPRVTALSSGPWSSPIPRPGR